MGDVFEPTVYEKKMAKRVQRAIEVLEDAGVTNPSTRHIAEYLNATGKYSRNFSADVVRKYMPENMPKVVFFDDAGDIIDNKYLDPETIILEKESRTEIKERLSKIAENTETTKSLFTAISAYVDSGQMEKGAVINTTALYHFAVKNGMTDLSKNQFSHEYHKFVRYLARHFGISPFPPKQKYYHKLWFINEEEVKND